MKKLMIIFIGAGMALVSCKTHLDGLASNASDDVYYNPAKERKVNIPPPAQQYESQQQYNPNQGKIAATAADKNNPYYKDPNFNYDDYYDNAYAARVKRFQNPLYGTSYYDSYYTNSYFYNYNPSSYGTSIYSSYNMGSPYGSSMYGSGMGYGSGYGGYYSPAATFNNAYYNPYYNGYGSSMSYGMGYGCGNGMGYGYNPYGYGMGYGYNPYSNGYGMGYGMGNGYYNSPMYGSTGYYNSYDYNSGTYHYGPRGTHTGGNSTTTSPMPQPHRFGIANTGIEGSPSSAPFNQERFNQVLIPKENYVKIVEERNPVINNSQYQSNGGGTSMQPNEGRPTNVNEGRPINNYNQGNTNGGTYTNYGGTNNGAVGNQQEYYSAPRTINNNQNPNTTVQPQDDPKPHKWFSGTNFGNDNNINNGQSTPSTGRWGGGNSGGSLDGGGNSGGGSTGGGDASHPRR